MKIVMTCLEPTKWKAPCPVFPLHPLESLQQCAGRHLWLYFTHEEWGLELGSPRTQSSEWLTPLNILFSHVSSISPFNCFSLKHLYLIGSCAYPLTGAPSKRSLKQWLVASTFVCEEGNISCNIVIIGERILKISTYCQILQTLAINLQIFHERPG